MTDDLNVPIGKAFECVFGEFRPRLKFLSEHQLEIALPAADQPIVQVVSVGATPAEPEMVMLSWTEADGTVVVHLQNYRDLTVLSHARLPDGTLVRFAGTIRWLASV